MVNSPSRFGDCFNLDNAGHPFHVTDQPLARPRNPWQKEGGAA
jgi:hypothetical protein